MATIDQQFVEYIVKTLVNNPENVNVTRTIDEKGVLLELSVDPEDIGRIIGRRGSTAQSIRTLLRALGTKNDARYNLKIVNTDEDYTPHESSDLDEEDLSASDSENDDYQEDEVEEEEVEEEIDEEDTESDSESDDLAEKTRAELADLDDLDI